LDDHWQFAGREDLHQSRRIPGHRHPALQRPADETARPKDPRPTQRRRTVIALFDGETTALDGKPNRNSYAWFMEMRDGKVVKPMAFFDSIAFDEFWKRVQPKEN
jgi:ketosteroid isomerase-like protein